MLEMVNKASDYSDSGRVFKILKWPRSVCNWLFVQSATMLLRNLMNYQDWHWWWVAWCQPNEARLQRKMAGNAFDKGTAPRRVNIPIRTLCSHCWRGKSVEVMQRKPCIETSSWNDDIAAELESPLRKKSVSRLAQWDSKRQWDNRLPLRLSIFSFSFFSTRSQRGNKNIWNSILHPADIIGISSNRIILRIFVE